MDGELTAVAHIIDTYIRTFRTSQIQYIVYGMNKLEIYIRDMWGSQLQNIQNKGEKHDNGKVALVTGASRGIGRACAIKLGEAGYKVAVNYNSNEAAANEVVEKIKAAGSEAVAIKANVSDLAQVKTMMREVINTFGQLDVLVNNAGIVKDEFVLMMNPDTIDQCLDLNIKGYMYCTQQAVLKMFSKKQGVIVNVSSVSSKLAVPGQSVYSATKGAVNSMTATMAKELAPYGIRVNAVAPGFIATDMVEALPEDKKEEYLKDIPMKRFGTAEEIGDVVTMLAGPACSYMTGQVIVLDGGLSL